MTAYRAVWSLLISRVQESGAIDVPLSPEDSLKARARDQRWVEAIQAERDPYMRTHDYMTWARKRKRIA